MTGSPDEGYKPHDANSTVISEAEPCSDTQTSTTGNN